MNICAGMIRYFALGVAVGKHDIWDVSIFVAGLSDEYTARKLR